MARTEKPEVFQVINTDHIVSVQLTIDKANLSALVISTQGKFIVRDAEAIDLLSALGLKPPLVRPKTLFVEDLN